MALQAQLQPTGRSAADGRSSADTSCVLVQENPEHQHLALLWSDKWELGIRGSQCNTACAEADQSQISTISQMHSPEEQNVWDCLASFAFLYSVDYDAHKNVPVQTSV